MKISVKVTINAPETSTEFEVIEYVEEAIRCWRGSWAPSNPFFQLEDKDFQVTKADGTED